MFQSAVLKLTAFYFLVLVAVCITFSFPAYAIASQRITQGAENQSELLRDLANQSQQRPGYEFAPGFNPREIFRDEIEAQIREDRRELLQSLLFANIIVLAGGTILCFLFAKRTLEPIEELHKAQERFTADASHELRTPLTVMKTEIDVALKQDLSPADLKAVLQSNLEEIERLTALSNHLLSLTKAEETTDFTTFNISNLVRSEVKALEDHYKISINSSIEADLTYTGSKPLIAELIRILVSNAIQYSGEQAPAIEITLKKMGNLLELTVRDEGIGIAPYEVEHIFERFYRGNAASSHNRNGHGLGLSLASQIAHQHGTRLQVKSEQGSYTEFLIAFTR